MARTLYRIAAVLIALLDLGHSAGYPWSDPAWGVDLQSVQSSHFNVLGFSRTYWDFYVGFGLSISVFLLLGALLAWQLGNVPRQTFPLLRTTAWGLTFCFAAITVLDVRYFFTIPIVMSSVVTVLLAAATWRSARAAGAPA
jgi:hypothetical protein